MSSGRNGVAAQVARLVGGLLAAATFVTWPLIFAYGDWLRFSSPHAPNYQTDHTIYYKGARGVFYITPQQNLLVGGGTTFILWCVGFAGVALLASSRRGYAHAGEETPNWRRALAYLAFAWWIALFLIPDHVMALFLTGSFAPPPDLHRFESTVVPPTN